MSPEALVALASGVALASLGVFLVALRPRPGEAVVFGAFAILWAGQVLSANLERITAGGAGVHAVALLVSFCLMAPATALLAHVAAEQVRGRAGALLRAAGAAVGAAGALFLAADPRRVVASVADAPDGGVVTALGPLALPLFLVPFHLAFVAACVATHARWRLAAPGAPRARARTLYCAFALFGAYVTVRNLAFALRTPPDLLLAGQGALAAVFYVAGALALGVTLARGADRMMVLSAVVPAATAAGEALLEPGSGLGTGTWRLACVAVVVYALARHRLFDFEVRLKESIAAILAAGLLAMGILASLVARGYVPLVAAMLAAGGCLSIRDRIGDLLFPHARRSPDYFRARRLDVYHVRLEQAIARPDAGDARDLARLRLELDVSEAEHAAMALVLRAHHGLAPAGDVVAGRYRLLRVLGEGGFGRAHLATDERTGALVVVKLAAGAQREAALTARVESQHVARVLDAGDGFLTMEYAEGGTLRDRLAKGPLAPAEVERVARGVLDALAVAHRAGIVHGDVKPGNVLLRADGAPLLGDFGAARAADERTRDAAAQASLQHASPEQLRGERATPRSDVYAMGALLHRCLLGHTPAAWEEPDEGALPERFRSTVVRALARDPAARFADAGEMRAALLGEVASLAG